MEECYSHKSSKASGVGRWLGYTQPRTERPTQLYREDSAAGSWAVVLAHWDRHCAKAPEDKRLREPPANRASRVTGRPTPGHSWALGEGAEPPGCLAALSGLQGRGQLLCAARWAP